MSCFIILFVLIAGCHSLVTSKARNSYQQIKVACRCLDFEVATYKNLHILLKDKDGRGANDVRILINDYMGRDGSLNHEITAYQKGMPLVKKDNQGYLLRYNAILGKTFYVRFMFRWDDKGDTSFIITTKNTYVEPYYVGEGIGASWTNPQPFELTTINVGTWDSPGWWIIHGCEEICFYEFVEIVLESVSQKNAEEAGLLFQALKGLVEEMNDDGTLIRFDVRLRVNILHAVGYMNLFPPNVVQEQAKQVFERSRAHDLGSEIDEISRMIDNEYEPHERKVMHEKVKDLMQYPGNSFTPREVCDSLVEAVLQPYFRQAAEGANYQALYKKINRLIDDKYEKAQKEEDPVVDD